MHNFAFAEVKGHPPSIRPVTGCNYNYSQNHRKVGPPLFWLTYCMEALEFIPNCSVVDPDPHHFGNLYPHPDPQPHQIKIRIRIIIYRLDPEPDLDPHQFADVKQKCMEYEPILALFKGFEPVFEARIWIPIRIRIRMKSKIKK
jgi:hypothetical protein